jgi:mono/diheme cytochrome c family protein
MKRYFILFIIVLFSLQLSAQEWVVAPADAALKSPFAFTDSTRKAGEVIYVANCKSCHGDPGKNNAIQLVPIPPDAASVKMQANTDGAMHFKLIQGRGPMPSFKNTLSSTDLWRVISFMRGYNPKYVQEVALPTIVGAAAAQNVSIKLDWNKASGQVEASLTSLKGQVSQPVAGAEVKLFAKRYFGNLPIDEARKSDAAGKVAFNFPKDLPGDSIGNVQLIVKLSDEVAYGEASAEATLAVGLPTNRPALTAQRAMWGVLAKAPIWLIFAYLLAVLTAWGFIAYVISQIKAIYRAGSNEQL